MRFCVLGSGSRGNCTLVESGGTSLLIDAGFSGLEIKRRLCMVGIQPEKLSAVLVTHEHNDHVSGVGVVSRQARVPVYANQATFAAAAGKLGRLLRFVNSAPGKDLSSAICRSILFRYRTIPRILSALSFQTVSSGLDTVPTPAG
jgi:phosphoribosyl 1,2-cyclic phosphodiesterase